MTSLRWLQVSSMLQILLAIDQLLNACTGGWADETLSARIWRNRNNSWYWTFLHKLVDTLFFWQKSHCYHAYMSEVIRTQLPSIYLTRSADV
jgi:predicted glycosyl hydrolase (DUF1957 family)